MLRIPTGKRMKRWLFTIEAEDVAVRGTGGNKFA